MNQLFVSTRLVVFHLFCGFRLPQGLNVNVVLRQALLAGICFHSYQQVCGSSVIALPVDTCSRA